jgi:chromate transporter
MTEAVPSSPPPGVSLAKLFTVFLYVGATSFGGGVVAYLREHLVVRQKWLDDDHFLAALEIGQTIPGLVSTNVSVIVGSRLRGVKGAIVSALGMILPGAVSVFILGLLYARFRTDPDVRAMLHGVGAAAVGLILAVALQVGTRAISKWPDLVILLAAFLMVGVFHISLLPVLVVLAPIAIGINRPDSGAMVEYHARRNAAQGSPSVTSKVTPAGGQSSS